MSSSSSSPITDKLPSAEELKQDVAKATNKSLSSLRDLAAGGVGGVFAVVVGHPFDLVKVRLQTAEKGVYKGAMDVVRRTIAKDGPRVSLRDTARQLLADVLIDSRDCMLVSRRHWSV